MKRFEIGLVILCLAFITIACTPGGGSTGTAETSDVSATEAGAAATESIDVYGTVSAAQSIDVALGFSARAERVWVNNGAEVPFHREILTLNIDDQRNSYASTERELRIARIELARLEREYEAAVADTSGEGTVASGQVATARRELDGLRQTLTRLEEWNAGSGSPELRRLSNERASAVTELERLREEADEQQALYAEGIITQTEENAAELAVDRQDAMVEALDLSIQTAREALVDQIEDSRLLIDQREAALSALLVQETRVRAPSRAGADIQAERVAELERQLGVIAASLSRSWLNGADIIAPYGRTVVSGLILKPGDVVPPQAELCSLIDLDSLFIEAWVPEDFIADVAIDDDAVVIPVADRDRRFSARVISIAGMGLDRNGETVIPITLSYEDAERFLRPNFNVEVRIGLTVEDLAAGEDQAAGGTGVVVEGSAQ